MARNIGPTTDILIKRVRQAGAVSLSPDFATQVLTIFQRLVNISLRRVFVSETLTTKKEKLLYSITSDLSSAVIITSILDPNDSDRELLYCPSIHDFSAYESDWFRNIAGTRFEAWTQIGQDFFIIYPAKAANSAVDVISVKATAIYADYTANYGTALELPDEDIDIVLRFAEQFLLLRRRDYASMKKELDELTKLMQAKDYVRKS